MRLAGHLLLRTGPLLSIVISHGFGFALPSPRGSSGQAQKAGNLGAGYITEPTFRPQIFETEFLNDGEASVDPGYIFIGTMAAPSGPHIYTSLGELVWYGNKFSRYRVQDFKVCRIQGEDHLCWTERQASPGGDRTVVHKIFVTSDYGLMKNFTARGDVHEFQVINDGQSYLTMDFRLTDHDLSQYDGPKDGHIRDACILEYEIGTWKKMFEWCYSDDLPLWETDLFFKFPGQRNRTSNISGQGTQEKPWDFAHMNSVDKDADGDYIASLRHFDQIIKVSGPNSTSGKPPGTLLWRLGGRSNDFEMDLNFSKQHDAKYVRTDQSESIISLLDNAWEGINEPSTPYSSGKIIRVNEDNMVAHLLHEYPHPYGKLSRGRGSMQVTEGGNAFVGWGLIPELTEYSHDGTPIFHARFAAENTSQFSYRAYKFPWVAKPTWKPKLVAYSHSCIKDNKPSYAYVSWNGATEVKKWRFYTSYLVSGPWLPAGTFEKTGFESRIKLDESAPYVLAEALDSENTVLGSVQEKTFVPGISLKHKCNKFSCPNHFKYDDAASRGAKCITFYLPALIPFFMLVVLFEFFNLLTQNITHWTVSIGEAYRADAIPTNDVGKPDATDPFLSEEFHEH